MQVLLAFLGIFLVNAQTSTLDNDLTGLQKIEENYDSATQVIPKKSPSELELLTGIDATPLKDQIESKAQPDKTIPPQKSHNPAKPEDDRRGPVHGPSGMALQLEKNGDFMCISNNASLNPSSGLSISIWFNPSKQIHPFPRLVSKLGFGGGYEFVLANRDAYTAPAWFRYQYDSSAPRFEDVGANSFKFEFGKWYQITGTWDGQKQRFFVNGKQKAERDAKNPIINNSRDIAIGQYGGQFVGLIDEVCIWNIGLEPKAVNELYSKGLTHSLKKGLVGWWQMDGNCKDSSGMGNNGFLCGNAVFVRMGKASK